MDGKTSIASLPLDGLMLWEVHFQSSYYDDDPRMPGLVPVDKRFFVLAKNRSEALGKVYPQLKELDQKYQKEERKVIASVVVLENLFAARDSSNDGRLGYHSMTQLSGIELSLDEDRKLYRLGVCLIPAEQ